MTAGAEREHVAAVVERTPDVLAAVLATYPPDALTTPPAAGEWSVHDVIEHLITGDGPAFRDRVAGITAGDPEIASFDPAAVMGARDPNAVPLDQLLDDLREQRRQSAELIRSLDVAALARTSMHPGGEFRADDFVNEWPFHDHDHLQQILDILKQWHSTAMSATMRRALELD